MQTVAVFFVLNFAAISLMIYALLWYFASENRSCARRWTFSTSSCASRRKGASGSSSTCCPGHRRAPEEGRVQHRPGHADVTVMFADIVGFTKMTEELSPVETVEDPERRLLDVRRDRRPPRVEKIKTIGDAYMAAAGIETGAQVHYGTRSPTWHWRCSIACTSTGRGAARTSSCASASHRARGGRRHRKKKFIYDMWATR